MLLKPNVNSSESFGARATRSFAPRSTRAVRYGARRVYLISTAFHSGTAPKRR
jgi:hypothetical protein